MEIRVGHLTSAIITDNPSILEALIKKYSFYVPGYQYVTAYRKGYWNGKKRYISDSGEFRTGLLSRILKDLESIGCTRDHIEISSVNEGAPIETVSVNNFSYRDYQKEAIEFCLSNRRCILDSPTGSGKTLIMAGVVASLLEHNPEIKGVILFKEKQHLVQTYEFFQQCGIPGIGVNYGEGFEYGNIMLSTHKSIGNILDTHLEDSNLLMVDEAHQFCKGESMVAAIESFPNAFFRFAFTATVPRDDAKNINGRMALEGAFGPVYVTRTAVELVEDGSLAKPIIQIVENDPGFVDPDITYPDAYLEYIVNNQERNEAVSKIVSMVRKSSKSAKILILVKNLDHIENLLELIPDAYVIEGKDNISDRYSKINKFLSPKESSVIIGTNVMQTGVSINEISHMINARGLESESATLQGLGRGLRKAEGLDVVYYYDFYDYIPYLDKHSKARIKHYKNLGFEVNYVRI